MSVSAQVSPTYYILSAVAITDLLTMLSYLPYAVYFYCIAMPEPEYQHRLVGPKLRGCNYSHQTVVLLAPRKPGYCRAKVTVEGQDAKCFWEALNRSNQTRSQQNVIGRA